MSLISFTDNFALINLYQNYQLKWQYIRKSKLYNPNKQHAMKKLHSYSNRNKIYKGQFFVVEGFWAENVQNLQYLLIL